MAYKIALNYLTGELQLVNAVPIPSANTIFNILVAGQSFSANTSYAVRWGIEANGENPTQVYVADYNATILNDFWVIGMALSTTAVTVGQNINVYSFGPYILGSADTLFTTSDVGNPVWLATNGTFTTVAPASDTFADEKIGIVMSPTQIWIDEQLMGIGSGGGGGGTGGVNTLNGLYGDVDIVAGTPNITITESGQNIEINFTGSGTGNVTGIAPTTVGAIAVWDNTFASVIQNSLTNVQDSGAIEAQAYITRRSVTGQVTVNSDETWIAPSIELALEGSIVIESGGDLLIV